ncbi:MAG TPA: DUF5678 domain-containing protein [Candidatus Nitrosotalea sp.]|nr:DUF5678 domain-containing protein [Candidatus Nitrosotalea sp.]
MSSLESRFLASGDFSEYEGEWVALLDRKIIGHGKTLTEVYDKIGTKRLTRTPLFHRIPKKEEAGTFVL